MNLNTRTTDNSVEKSVLVAEINQVRRTILATMVETEVEATYYQRIATTMPETVTVEIIVGCYPHLKPR
jgi:hypothetical protein